MSGIDGIHDVPDEPCPAPTGLYAVMGRSGPIGRNLTYMQAVDLARVSGGTVSEQAAAPWSLECSCCHGAFVPGDAPDCGEPGCPAEDNAKLLKDAL